MRKILLNNFLQMRVAFNLFHTQIASTFFSPLKSKFHFSKFVNMSQIYFLLQLNEDLIKKYIKYAFIRAALIRGTRI